MKRSTNINTLTAIFDSCHSGSVAAAWRERNLRRGASPKTRATPKTTITLRLRKIGGIILAAAQLMRMPKKPWMSTMECPLPRRFRWLYANVQPGATEYFARDISALPATLHSLGSLQEPVLAGTEDRWPEDFLANSMVFRAAKSVCAGTSRQTARLCSMGLSMAGTQRRTQQFIQVDTSAGSRSQGPQCAWRSWLARRYLAPSKKVTRFEIDRWPSQWRNSCGCGCLLPTCKRNCTGSCGSRSQEKPGMTWVQTNRNHTHAQNPLDRKYNGLQTPTKTLDLGNSPTEASVSAQLETGVIPSVPFRGSPPQLNW